MRLEGGFQGRTNKLVDSCYSFWQVRAIKEGGEERRSLKERRRGDGMREELLGRHVLSPLSCFA